MTHNDVCQPYKESGDVRAVERNTEGQTRNSIISHNHDQTLTGVTYTYHVHSVVTGYDSDGEPQGDLYPQLDAPGCGSAVCFPGLFITLLVLPILSACLYFPHDFIRNVAGFHAHYVQQQHSREQVERALQHKQRGTKTTRGLKDTPSHTIRHLCRPLLPRLHARRRALLARSSCRGRAG